jgi:hypothetical protein
MTPETTIWRTFPLFISSTFKDMDAERDMLKKRVIPRLTETLRSRRIDLKVIDLRWGVNTASIDESEREATVLKVCLDAIRNNRPFFIALLGERYGWVPEPPSIWENVIRKLSKEERTMLENTAGKSVTELEILFGALGNVNNILSRSLFYFREKESYLNMPETLFAKDYQEAIYAKRIKLLSLKKQIKRICNENNYSDAVHEYLLKWNSSKNRFDDVDFCEQIYEHLLREIEEEIADGANIVQVANQYEEEANALHDFIYLHAVKFTGRKRMIERLKDFALNNSQALILTGFSGCGKSAVFCKLYQELQNDKNPRHIILAHSAGVTADSQYVDIMLEQWNRQLEDTLKIPNRQEGELKSKSWKIALKDRFLELAKAVKKQGYKLILLVDAIDRFVPDTVAEYMQWLPEDTSLIATALPEATAKPGKIHRNLKVECMDLFSEEDAGTMVIKLCSELNKDIPQRALKALVEKCNADDGSKAYTSPLWLQLATNLLFALDADDFREIRARSEYDDAGKIEGFLCDLLESFPSDAGALFLVILNRIGSDFGQALTQCSMDYLAVSYSGLREKDLEVILGNDWDTLEFACLRRWLGQLVIETGSNRKWNIAHNHLILKLRERLSVHERTLHKTLGEYLLTLPDDDLLYPTAIYHLIKADDKKRAALFLTATKRDVSHTLTVFYNYDHSFLDWLVDAARYLDNQQFCDYSKKIIRLFNELPWTDYDGYIHLCIGLFRIIDMADADLSQKRVVGEICQSASLWCKRMDDTESLFYFSQIQADCFTSLIEAYPDDESMKNSLAIALSCLGEYYLAVGDNEKAMNYFEKIVTI